MKSDNNFEAFWKPRCSTRFDRTYLEYVHCIRYHESGRCEGLLVAFEARQSVISMLMLISMLPKNNVEPRI